MYRMIAPERGCGTEHCSKHIKEESVTELMGEYTGSLTLMDDSRVCICIHRLGSAWLSIRTVGNMHSAPH